MKSFRQFNEYTANATLKQAEDETHAAFNVQDPIALQKLNAYVGSIADREYLQPDAALEQLNTRIGTVGLSFNSPKIDGEKGTATVEVKQFGGRYGKTSDNSNGPMSKGTEMTDDDGISHRKEGGLKLEFKWEKQSNNTYKVFANLI